MKSSGQIAKRPRAGNINANLCPIIEVFHNMPADERGAFRDQNSHVENGDFREQP